MATDSAGIVIAINTVLSENATCSLAAEPSVRIGTAGGEPEHELYRVFGASRLSDGSVALVNQGSQQLRIFDSAGNHVRSSGRKGRGPGEFENAFHLWILPGDTVWVGDYRPWQFMVFGPDGSWHRTVRPEPILPNPPGVMEVFSDGRFLLAERPVTSQGDNWSARSISLVLYDPDGAVRDTIASIPDGRRGTVSNSDLGLYPLFESFSRVDASGRTLVIAHDAEAQLRVYEVADTIALRRVVRWPAADRTIHREDISAERQRLADQYPDLEAGMRRRLVEPLISDERPVADRFPVMTGLRVSRDGWFWIREFVTPAAVSGQRWMAFDSDGRYVCRANLPDNADVLEFGARYVILKEQDELGVEQVALYAVNVDMDIGRH